MNYLKVGKATELSGKNYILYRALEMLPGFLSIGTLLALMVLSYFKPVWVAFFVVAFDVYWLLLVLYLALHLLAAYRKLKINSKINWEKKCKELTPQSKVLTEETNLKKPQEARYLYKEGLSWQEVINLVILPTYNEDLNIIESSLNAIKEDSYPKDKMIIVLAMEARAGEEAYKKAEIIKERYKNIFPKLFVTFHPDGIEGELKGKGANQAWAIKQVRKDYIDPQNLDYEKILVSVFDIDTVITPGYFFCLTYRFLTTPNPYHASYQPVPVYHNNLWKSPFFARIAASSNSFWQMMQQIRKESLATYSSHSMTFKALVEIDFWATNMVSEDSRIFWHLLLHHKGNYRVEPLHFPVSMDVTMDKGFLETAKSLYKQQRRWAWGSENIPYLIFNTIKHWKTIDRKELIRQIFVQLYGFHSWATNALIIAVVGWMPLLLGGDAFNTTVLSGNLPMVTRVLMNLAMVGLILSSVVSTLLLPKIPEYYKNKFLKKIYMALEWIVIPVTIIVFGSIPCLDAQIKLMRGKYMGFWVTPKKRE